MPVDITWLEAATAVIGAASSAALLYYYTGKRWRELEVAALPILFLAFLITLSPIGLLIADITYGESVTPPAVNGTDPTPQQSLYNEGLLITWKVVFWATQALSWVILPILQEYSVAGEFTFKSKMWRAVKENVKLYIIMGTVLGLLLLYVAFVSEDGLSTKNIIGLGIAASNAFGLVLIILFLGYGLTQLPRSLWFYSNREYTLEFKRWSAPGLHEHYETTKLRWADLQSFAHEGAQKAAATGDQELIDRVNSLIDLLNTDTSPRDRRVASYIDDTDMTNWDLTTDEGIVKLHARILHLKSELEGVKYQWRSLLEDVIALEDVARLEEASEGPTKDAGTGRYLKEVYQIYLRGTVMKVGAVVSGVLSLSLLWSFGVATPLGSYSLVAYLVVGGGNASRIVQVVSLLILLPYAGLCCYWGLFKFKLFEFNLLVPSCATAANLCFTATFLCRLIIPLCYCFLNICHLAGPNHHIAYTAAVIDNMNVINLLGESFNRFLPSLIIVVAVGVVSDLIPKLLRACGLELFTFSDFKKDADTLAEGREILARERAHQIRREGRSERQREREMQRGTNPLTLNVDDEI